MKLNLFITICLALLSISITAQTYSGGSGTQTDPYRISRNADMQALAAAVNGNSNYSTGKYFLLTQDITDEIVTIIGTSNYPFRGNFDGGGYKVNMNINTTNEFAGVFGYVYGAVIKNLGVMGSVVSSPNNSRSGGICGLATNNCTITNCYNTGNISSSAYSGGICGSAHTNCTITNCYNTGSISSSSSSNYYPSSGGICGFLGASSYISNCFAANSTITAKKDNTNSTDIGRIVGSVNNGIIVNCYALATMQLNGTVISNQITDSKNGKDTNIASFQSQSWVEDNLTWDFVYMWRIPQNGGFPTSKTKAKVNFNLSTTNITYGESVTFTSSSNHATTPILYLSSDKTVAEVAYNNINIKKAGTVTLLAYQAHTDIYAPDTAKVVLTINKAPLTVQADNATSIYGDTPQFSCSYRGFVNSETASVLIKQPLFTCSGNAQSNVGSYMITPSGAEVENYTITYKTGQLEIVKRGLKVTPNNTSRIYGDYDPTYSFSYEGFVNGNTVSNISVKPTATSTATRTSPVGDYEISCSGGSATNYTFIEYGKATLEITKAPLTVTPQYVSRAYGSENPIFELSYSGFKNSETKAVLLEEPQITTTATQLSSAGQYLLAVSGGNAQNYSFVYGIGTLTVNKVPLTAQANNITSIYGDTPQFNCSYSGFVNNETASVLTKQPLFTCPGNAQSNVGSYTITPSGAEAENYTITYKTGQLEIIKRGLKVTPNNTSRIYGDYDPTYSFSYEGFVNGNTVSNISVKPTATSTATRTSPVGDYEISCSGGSATNYTFIEYGKATLEITKAPLTVTPQYASRPYGSENPIFELSYSGFKNSETKAVLLEEPQITTTATQLSSAGQYPLTASGGNAQNYSFIYNNGTLNITKVPLIVIADNKSRNEGEANPAFTLSYNGFKNNDNETVLDELPFIHSTADVHSPAGTYDIQLFGGNDNNYNYTLVNGVLTVLPLSGINEFIAKQISVFPNPVKADIFIRSELPIEKVEVYTLTGTLLLQENNFNEKISLANLPSNLYMLKIYTDRGMAVQKIVKK